MELLTVSIRWLEGTSQMNSIAAVPRVKVSADGHGVVSHAGVGMLREVAGLTGLSTQVTAALADTYRGPWIYDPGSVFADLAAAVAGGADCIDGVGQRCGDREHVFGPAAWAAGAAPAPGVVAPRRRCHHDHRPLRQQGERGPDLEEDLVSSLPAGVPDRPEIAGGEALSGLLRPGNAGSNTAADHVTVLEQALESLPAAYRPDPDDPAGQQILVRSDSAGATHAFADACRTAGVGFSFGYAVDARVRDAVEILNRNDSWYPAIEADGDIRDGAWVAEATGLVEMSGWPARTRLILRKERPHPGAQLRFTDSDGLRITAFITDTPTGVVPGQLGGLELRHRQHARVEDRIRQAKATGLANLPCHRSDANAAWLEIIFTATDLVAWFKLIGFTEHRDLATCEIETFRYRVLHVAAQITRGARQIRLLIDATWRWATAISQGWQRLRAAFT
jgi:hypothetical protein